MADFLSEYKRLNDAQKVAVEAIDGPVMVIAGPGTGKTQLLSMRVANILQKTDALPTNILCITYSESGQSAVRERLVKLIGQPGYQVPVYTFHGFGTDIMNRFPEFFYRGAQFRPADELKQYEILQAIFNTFPPTHPLYGYRDDRYTQLGATLDKIKEFKQAGFAPEAVRQILDHNEAFLNFCEPLCDSVIGGATINAKTVPAIARLLEQVQAKYSPNSHKNDGLPAFIVPLCELFMNSLQRALDEGAALSGREATKPLTTWKNQWRDSGHKGRWVFSARAAQTKLRAVIDVYELYQKALQDEGLIDYDDMIMQVLEKLESNEELQSNLQEQYLYILVDEYQDTNQAQLRMVRALADHPVHEGSPNLMVVGDDDQGIYKFQGADLSNMTEFMSHYPNAKIITLIDNYRSAQPLLDTARAVIIQGTERLENRLEGINKSLTARSEDYLTGTVEQPLFDSCRAQYQWVAQTIKTLIETGTPPSEIAVLGRGHKDLQSFAAHLKQLDVPIDYEKRENILETDHIIRLLRFSELIQALAGQNYDEADALFPEVLSYEFWRLPIQTIWDLSLTAYRTKDHWFSVMESSKDEAVQEIYDFFAYAALQSGTEPLEMMLDIIIGIPGESNEDLPRSPYFQYYFGKAGTKNDEQGYVTLLSYLITLRRRLREFRPDQRLFLKDFITFAELHKERKLGIIASHSPETAKNAVRVMTAHKAKGLEFEVVFILNCLETTWGQPKRARPKLIKYPPNLRLEPVGDELDDWLRLFYVAMTRAKRAVYLCLYTHEDSGEAALPLSFLNSEALGELVQAYHPEIKALQHLAAQLLADWREPHYSALHERQTDLSDTLERYRLSATHLDNFLDVEHGGPRFFFLRNLLQFPQAMRSKLAYGSAIHAALATAHNQVNEHERIIDPGSILNSFRNELHGERMTAKDEAQLIERGEHALTTILDGYSHFFRPGQMSEKGFGNLPVVIGEARLTGKLDLIEFNSSHVVVTDYKTGKANAAWSLDGAIKAGNLYKYRRQLLFYKLLLERSGDITFKDKRVQDGRLIFVEPTKDKKVIQLEYGMDAEELARLEALIPIVWRHIMELDFPDVSKYDKSVKGVRRFEDDLLDGKV